MTKLSAYILTHNSERYLRDVIAPLQKIADEILILDSGSKDQTKKIAEELGCRFIVHPMTDFREQRNFAQDHLNNDWILFLDSDEVMNAEMADYLLQLKKNDFSVDGKPYEAFQLNRRWFLFGKEVHAFYPISNPDAPVRMYKRSQTRFSLESNRVHESPHGFTTLFRIEVGAIYHYSCDSVEYLFHKLNQYTSIAAVDALEKGKTSSWWDAWVHGFGAWIKWYWKKGAYKDGAVGILMGVYAFWYTYMKYVKLLFLQKKLENGNGSPDQVNE